VYPQLTREQAFAKVFESNFEMRKAISIAKTMPFVANFAPAVVGGIDAVREGVDNTEQSEAYRQLVELGKQRWPTATEAQQFANAFTDPANRELAAKAHQRPAADSYLRRG
jgi:hypothetical protein